MAVLGRPPCPCPLLTVSGVVTQTRSSPCSRPRVPSRSRRGLVSARRAGRARKHQAPVVVPASQAQASHMQFPLRAGPPRVLCRRKTGFGRRQVHSAGSPTIMDEPASISWCFRSFLHRRGAQLLCALWASAETPDWLPETTLGEFARVKQSNPSSGSGTQQEAGAGGSPAPGAEPAALPPPAPPADRRMDSPRGGGRAHAAARPQRPSPLLPSVIGPPVSVPTARASGTGRSRAAQMAVTLAQSRSGWSPALADAVSCPRPHTRPCAT